MKKFGVFFFFLNTRLGGDRFFRVFFFKHGVKKYFFGDLLTVSILQRVSDPVKITL